MPETTISVSNITDLTPEVIANEALGPLMANSQLAKVVTRDGNLEKEKEGETLTIAKRGTLTPNQKVRKENVTIQSPSTSSTTVTLQHWETTISMEDIAKTVGVNKIQIDVGYISDAVGGLVELIDEQIAALFSDAGLAEVGDGTGPLTEAMILDVRAAYTDLKAPQGDRHIAAGSSQYTDLLQIDRFTTAEKYGKSGVIADGALGKIHGFNAHETPFAPIVTTKQHGAMFHKYGIVLATRVMDSFVPEGAGVKIGYVTKDGLTFRIVISYNANLLATQITIDTLFGVNFMREELVTRINTLK